MSEKEILAIQYLKRYIEWETYGERSLETDIQTVLNLIQKQEGKIKLLKDQLQYVIDEYGETIEKQEKIIDKMAEYFEGYEMNDVITFENKEQVKEYFEEEVEKEC